jgi:hypothetical protein
MSSVLFVKASAGTSSSRANLKIASKKPFVKY